MQTPFRYHLPTNPSPTIINLTYYLKQSGWVPTRFAQRAHFSTQHLAFDTLPAQCLEYKHLLAALLADETPAVMPKTYYINDTNWPRVLAQLEPATWILKPSMLNNGQHIHIFTHPEQLKAHYSQPQRMGGDHVLQHYITRPHLLQGPKLGHKYSLRLFMILSTHFGAFLYPKGYFNIALKPYIQDQYDDLCPHLTNEHLTNDRRHVIQIPTDQFALFQPFYPQIKAILTHLTTRLQKVHPYVANRKIPHRLAIFGCDFLVDAALRVWLLETNHAPCFPVEAEHPLQAVLYADFWQALIADFIVPRKKNTPSHQCHHFDFLS